MCGKLIQSGCQAEWFSNSAVRACARVCVCMCVCMHVQSCSTLCDPTNCGPPCSSVHEFFQARILEWVAVSYSRGSS